MYNMLSIRLTELSRNSHFCNQLFIIAFKFYNKTSQTTPFKIVIQPKL